MFGNIGNMFNNMANAMAQAQAQAQAQQQFSLQPFKKNYRCFPVVMCNKPNLEAGDKIILPPTALDHLARLRVTYPMMFSITNKKSGRQMHAGVMEFSGEEGVAYIPYWMMQNLLIESGEIIEITNVTLPKGNFVKLQPHTTKFTQLYNPRVVLETALRNFSCLTKGDTIAIQHGDDNYYLDIVEVKPGNAVSVVETDMNVDFAPPKDYKEETYKNPSSTQSSPAFQPAESKSDAGGFSIKTEENETTPESKAAPSFGNTKGDYFSKLGSGNRLSGKSSSNNSSPAIKPAGHTSGYSLSSIPSSPNVTITPHTTAAATRKEVVETQGQWDFVYAVDDKGGKKLLRRTPHKNATGGSSTARSISGKGYSLK
jgi:ubiquitin fusion degradation protein 1